MAFLWFFMVSGSFFAHWRRQFRCSCEVGTLKPSLGGLKPFSRLLVWEIWCEITPDGQIFDEVLALSMDP